MSDPRLARCFVSGCEKSAVRRFRCKDHQGCNECSHPTSHFHDCPKIDASQMETTT